MSIGANSSETVIFEVNMSIITAAHPTAQAAPARMPHVTFTWGSVLLALVQSGCAILVSIQRIAVPLGLVSLASVQHHERAFHQDAVRIPMLAVAALASAVNLYVLCNAWRLRNRPEARWRREPLARREKLRAGWVLASSLVTLALVAGELVVHPHYHPVAAPAAGHSHSAPPRTGAYLLSPLTIGVTYTGV